jgi:hypothetical protein
VAALLTDYEWRPRMTYFDSIVLPIYLAKRMVENRGGVATERQDRLEIRRNGELLAAPLILDGCVRFTLICSAFGAQS